ncbi:MAG TPA: hypothetical protein PL045_09540, partial [Chitinophagaceae bacterium]|nr:hypothetical protein [Chitinophagaceae bacterium]
SLPRSVQSSIFMATTKSVAPEVSGCPELDSGSQSVHLLKSYEAFTSAKIWDAPGWQWYKQQSQIVIFMPSEKRFTCIII